MVLEIKKNYFFYDAMLGAGGFFEDIGFGGKRRDVYPK